MELSDTLRTLLRRWYILLLGLLMTAGLGWAVYRAVPTTYEATGSILLMPSETMVGKDGNPYLYLGGMRDVLDVLVRRSDSEQVREATLSRFEGADYSVAPDATTQSPIVVVTVETASPENSVALLQVVMTTVGNNLGAMQDELALPELKRIRIRELVVDASATANTGTARQAAIATVGAGFVGTLLLTGYVDGLLVRRRARHSVPRNQPTDSVAPVTDDVPTPVTTPTIQQLLPAEAKIDAPGSPGSPVVVGAHVDTHGGGTGRAPGLYVPENR